MDIIKSGGYKISALDIERVIYNMYYIDRHAITPCEYPMCISYINEDKEIDIID